MPVSLRGKGLWAYAHGGFSEFEGRIGHALRLAPQMGATHILFKVGQGSRYYEDRASVAQGRIEEAGLVPFAWMWLTLSDPESEAQVVKRAFDEGYEGFVFDVESHENPELSCSGRYEQASQLGGHLEELGVDAERLYLCSFPNIYMHRDLPYDQMAGFCRGGTMPMAYGTFLRPPEKVIDEWTYGDHERWCQEREDRLPVYPVLGPYYDDAGTNLMTAEAFGPWLDRLMGHGPTFFSVYAARSVDPTIAPLIRAFALSDSEERRRGELLRRLLRAVGGLFRGRIREEEYYVVVESPALGFLRLRAGPTTESDEILRIPHATLLRSLEGEATVDKVNRTGRWLRVRTPEGKEGYVAAWYLRWSPKPDERQPVSDSALRVGQSAWVFGIHAASIDEDDIERDDSHISYREEIRGLFQGTGRRGWVLFTEAIGCNPHDIALDEQRKARFWNWARGARYGVIVRLNHGYEPSGALPESTRYVAFAETCAAYARKHLKHLEVDGDDYTWVIIIANEQNNPREWPGGPVHPQEVITPERYARAFNLTYRAIKHDDVLPNATVIPGAVDPYNYDSRLAQTPLDYFQRMLEGIERVDGFALHTYTHGHNTGFIKHLKKFGDAPLTDHYYDFQAYRLFMERIPAKWRHLPVYVTETNPLFKAAEGDWGWKDENIGWIRAAYREIDEWNSTPGAQQIRALLLFRWAGDEWTMRRRGQLAEDFRQALAHDYRWRA